MTVSAVTATLQYLRSYKSDLEYQLMSISNKRMRYAYWSSQLALQVQTDPDVQLSDNPQYQYLVALDKMAEQQQKTYETQQQMVSAQISSYEKLQSNNISSDFKVNFGGGGQG